MGPATGPLCLRAEIVAHASRGSLGLAGWNVMRKSVGIVSYGIGNVGSVVNMLRRVGAEPELVSSPAELMRSGALILPGVGHFGHAMEALQQRGLDEALRRRVTEGGVPLLGICLGMQLLGRHSEEGDVEGLNLIDARFTRFVGSESSGLRVPHMGWNTATAQKDNPLVPLGTYARYYFVHSYKAECRNPADVVATTNYGGEFCCAYSRDNVFGVQFHPEKSHRYGMDLFSRFVTNLC